MNVNPISFNGIYSIQKSELKHKYYSELLNKKYLYGMEIESGSDLSNNFSKWYITVPNTMDKKIERLFNWRKIPFKKINENDALDLDSIFLRMCQINDDDYILRIINTSKLDKALQAEEGYVGINGKGGSKEKYDKFKRFLRTQQAIIPPKISIEEQDGRVSVQMDDGRHRFAVLRDMGIREMPVLIRKTSILQNKL